MIFIVNNPNADYDETRNIVVRANCELDAKLICFQDQWTNYNYLIRKPIIKEREEEFFNRLEKLAIIWLEKISCELLEPEGEPEIFLYEAMEG